MQLPSARKPAGWRLLLAVATATIAGLVTFAPASAAPLPDPAKVTANDTYIKSLCQFTVTSANYNAGTVRGRLTAKTSWNGQAGFKNLAHVSIECTLFDSDFTVLKTITDEDDARATYETDLVTVPLDTNYHIGVLAFYTLRNGNLGGVANVH